MYGVSVALNIKSERVHALARQAAQRTGLSQTSVVEQALLRYLEGLPGAGEQASVRAETKFREARAIAVEFADTLSDRDRAAIRQQLDSMYDADGLPR